MGDDPNREQLVQHDSTNTVDWPGKPGQQSMFNRLIASSLEAAPEQLRLLAASNDRLVRHNLILNPATPPDALIALAPEFPREFFNHPLLDLMILEDPQLLKRLQPGTLKGYLSDPDCPESFIIWACKHGTKGDQLVIMKRPNLATRWLKAIANGPHPRAAERAMDKLIDLGESW